MLLAHLEENSDKNKIILGDVHEVVKMDYNQVYSHGSFQAAMRQTLPNPFLFSIISLKSGAASQ